ncbi:MAG TPA: AI-2E family transporter [Oscillatoriales bacterium UBA8482]|nr:MAG: AI-2E family transporter [Oscillatoriales cyanobacterium CG2_30_40_61]HBW57873.1 AI-2E family transporter [Oscillatoriales bacterium UBA8482]
MKSERRISFSLSSLLLVLGAVFLLILLWQLRGLIVLLMISVVLAASIVPIVNWAETEKVPRWLAVILVYLTLIAGLTGFGLVIGPAVVDQITLLVSQSPIFVEKIIEITTDLAGRLGQDTSTFIEQLIDTQSLTSWVIRSSQQLILRSYGITRGILGGVASLILALFISGYMVADSKTLIHSLIQFFPYPWNQRLAAQVNPITQRMGGYIRGRILVSAILGIATTTALGFLGLKDFAIGLGAIAGVTNLIPFLGPILGAIPALIVALAKGGFLVVWVLLLYGIIQNIETYVLDPLLVGSSVGIHPLYQLLSVLGGVQVMGILGALIVPPWFAGVAALVENLYLQPKLIAEQQEESSAPGDGVSSGN